MKLSSMATALDEIVAATRSRLAMKRRAADLRAMERKAAITTLGLSARAGVGGSQGGGGHCGTEKGIAIEGPDPRRRFDPAALARELEEGGAAALSVLTEPEFFQGSLDNLRACFGGITLPCLRKDFIVDEFQIVEARAHSGGCDSADRGRAGAARILEGLAAVRARSGLDVLCEAHDEDELQRALDAGCDSDRHQFAAICGLPGRPEHRAPAREESFRRDVLAVAESGIDSRRRHCGACDPPDTKLF